MEGLRPEDPERVGRYRLLRRLGSGGMGRVYLGQSPSGRQVAVKIIRAELADNNDFRQRFRQEVKAARRVGGIFTAPVVDADPDAPEPWMVTAFVSGPSLAEAVAKRGPMPVGAVLILAAGLAEGLSSVHAAGLVHRDLKPSNVLLASDGPRIIDFGISRSAESVGPTRAGGVIGSPGFMSPEQALGDPVGPPSDIFSLGSVLAYAATGIPPFGDGPPSALLYRVVHGEAAIGDVPPELRPLVARCLLSDPAARPTTDDLLGELGEAAPVQGWLEWQGTGEEPAGKTVPSGTWSSNAAVADLGANEMLARPATPDGSALAPVPADVVLAGASGPGSDVSGASNELPGFAGSKTSRAEGPPTDAGADGGGLGHTPAGSIGWLFPDPSDAPGRGATPPFRDGRRRRAVLVAAGAAGAIILVALAIWLVPRLNPNPAAAGGPAAKSPAASAPAHPTSSPSPDPTSQTNGNGATPLSPAQVVIDFFTAINEHHLAAAWRLGGDHLYASTSALISAWSKVSYVGVTILGVRDHTVLASIDATSVNGTDLVLEQAFVVENGAIVARETPPAGAGG